MAQLSLMECSVRQFFYLYLSAFTAVTLVKLMFIHKIMIDNSLKHVLCLCLLMTCETVEDSSTIILNCMTPYKSDSSFQSSTPFRPQTLVFIFRDNLAFVLIYVKDGVTLLCLGLGPLEVVLYCLCESVMLDALCK